MNLDVAVKQGEFENIECQKARLTPIVRADHPFIFIIQERETGNILFLGKVVNPVK